MLTLDQYIDLLQTHDWLFEYSDDYDTWKISNEFQQKIIQAQKALDPDFLYWNKFAHPNFKKEK